MLLLLLLVPVGVVLPAHVELRRYPRVGIGVELSWAVLSVLQRKEVNELVVQ